MYPKIILSHPIFFGQRACWNSGKVAVFLSVIPTVYCSAERSLSLLRIPKTDQKHHGTGSVMDQALLYIERVYVNRVDTEKVIDEFSSKKVRSKFFFQLIFIGSKGDLSLTY